MENAVRELMGQDKEKARPVIPETMRAAVVEKFREPLQIREVPVPSPGPGQALVQIVATGVCHTDLHAGRWRLAGQTDSAIYPRT